MMAGIKKLTVLLTMALFAAACQTTEHQAPKPEDDASESQSWETVYYMCEALESPMEHPACNTVVMDTLAAWELTETCLEEDAAQKTICTPARIREAKEFHLWEVCEAQDPEALTPECAALLEDDEFSIDIAECAAEDPADRAEFCTEEDHQIALEDMHINDCSMSRSPRSKPECTPDIMDMSEAFQIETLCSALIDPLGDERCSPELLAEIYSYFPTAANRFVPMVTVLPGVLDLTTRNPAMEINQCLGIYPPAEIEELKPSERVECYRVLGEADAKSFINQIRSRFMALGYGRDHPNLQSGKIYEGRKGCALGGIYVRTDFEAFSQAIMKDKVPPTDFVIYHFASYYCEESSSE